MTPGCTASSRTRIGHGHQKKQGPRSAFPQVEWVVGKADLDRWRGELDYWVFLDGELGRVTGSVNGDAGAIREGALQGTIRVNLTATSRGEPFRIDPPTR